MTEPPWFGDVERPPQTQEQLRNQVLWALAPSFEPGSLEWLRFHLARFTYKPGWSWTVESYSFGHPEFVLIVRVRDPNRRLAKELERRRLPQISAVGVYADDRMVGQLEPTLRFWQVRSALHPDHPACSVEARTTSPIPPYVDTEDELARWFLHTLEQTEMQSVGLWLKYRDTPVDRKRT